MSYDSPEMLAAFAERQGISFPLLADTGSRVIDVWGLRNEGARGREVGVPHPGTFIIDRQLRVVERAFEQAYQERSTAAGILARMGGAVAPGAPATAPADNSSATLGVSDTPSRPAGG